jgi:hypothetical protein
LRGAQTAFGSPGGMDIMVGSAGGSSRRPELQAGENLNRLAKGR